MDLVLELARESLLLGCSEQEINRLVYGLESEVERIMYVSPNFKSKKELIQAVKDGKPVTVYAPGLGTVPDNGTVSLEGPHSPEPHKWYATGTMEKGKLVKVK